MLKGQPAPLPGDFLLAMQAWRSAAAGAAPQAAGGAAAAAEEAEEELTSQILLVLTCFVFPVGCDVAVLPIQDTRRASFASTVLY